MNDERVSMIRDEKIPKVLLRMGLPTMVGMLVGALYNVVDAYFVGGLGTSQMGGCFGGVSHRSGSNRIGF